MNENVLFLKSPCKEKIYGGYAIQKMLGIDNPNKIGEYWAISAHPNGPSIVEGTDKTLAEIYEERRDLFHHAASERFPILVKINDIHGPVSIQVHPGDEYAKTVENDNGKSEFNLFLEVKEGTKVIRGHTAKTKEEFINRIEKGEIDELVIRKAVHSGDYSYTPSGILHGIEGEMLMAEVQQSSDVTYRIYDYDNVDAKGNPRPLHIQKAVDVTRIPHYEDPFEIKVSKEGKTTVTEYIDCAYFKITRFDVKESVTIDNERYHCVLVLGGEGTLKVNGETFSLKPGMPFIITSNVKTYTVEGKLDLLVSEPKDC